MTTQALSSENADFADFEFQGAEGNEPILMKLPIRYPCESAIPIWFLFFRISANISSYGVQKVTASSP